MTESPWLTIAEAAAYLKVNPKTASAWALSGRIPAARIGGRGPWRIHKHRLDEYLNRLEQQPGRAVSGSVRSPLRALGPSAFFSRGHSEKRQT